MTEQNVCVSIVTLSETQNLNTDWFSEDLSTSSVCDDNVNPEEKENISILHSD